MDTQRIRKDLRKTIISIMVLEPELFKVCIKCLKSIHLNRLNRLTETSLLHIGDAYEFKTEDAKKHYAYALELFYSGQEEKC
jgi:hypothetical protein